MMRSPNHVWLFTGSWPFSVFGVLPEEIVRAYAHVGFKFDGPGWYPKFRFLIEPTGEQRSGRSTYQVLKFDNDPRPALRAASELPGK